MANEARGMTLDGALPDLAVSVGAQLNVHARDLDSDREVGIGAEEPVVLASVFKVPVLVELTRQIAFGEIEATARVRVPPEQRSQGPTGLSVMLDEVELSVRDLALSMMTVSDNAATDVVMDLVGVDRIDKTMRELGLDSMTVPYTCRTLYDQLAADTGVGSADEFDEVLADQQAAAAMLERVRGSAVLDPTRTNSATPADVTRLLGMIWRDEAGPPQACAEVRRIMALQVWPHRLRSGFPDEVKVAGKTGTLPFIRNEAGVIEYPDGGRYAVAVFLRLAAADLSMPDADRAIGTAARHAVEHLRTGMDG